MSAERLRVDADARAREWLDQHPSADPHVAEFATGQLDGGTVFLIACRVAARMPSSFALTARGRGRLKHLDLDLEGEQWGDLLYT